MMNTQPDGLTKWYRFVSEKDIQGVTIFFRAGHTLSPLRCLMLRASHDLKCKRCRQSLLLVFISCREKWAEQPEKPFHILA